MQLHERTLKVQQASADLRMVFLDWERRHDLTLTEASVVLTDLLASTLKYVLRAERHPDDPDRKG